MKVTGIVRKVDELGRLVLPIELRRTMGIEIKDPVEIFVDKEYILLKKNAPSCVLCGGDDDFVAFMPVVGAQTAYADATPAALDPESITVQILDSSSLIAYPGDTVRISMTITNHNSDLSPMI